MSSARASSSPSPRPSSTSRTATRSPDPSRVLGFSTRETAEALETTPVSVDNALQRAHKAIEERVPTQTQQATLRALGDSELRQIVERFTDAWKRNDVDTVVAMLADDVRMTMPPWPSWYSGRDAVATFLRNWPLSLK
jgi:RNA polymerase sigma-70 factor, ECF subfamily